MHVALWPCRLYLEVTLSIAMSGRKQNFSSQKLDARTALRAVQSITAPSSRNENGLKAYRNLSKQREFQSSRKIRILRFLHNRFCVTAHAPSSKYQCVLY